MPNFIARLLTILSVFFASCREIQEVKFGFRITIVPTCAGVGCTVTLQCNHSAVGCGAVDGLSTGGEHPRL